MRSHFLFFLLALTFLASCSSAPTEERGDTPDRPPNIVIVFTDDQGYQDLGCFGAPDIPTPNIDRMATQGTRFTRFYVAQPVCSASRTALLTGCYPNRVGIHGALGPDSDRALAPEETTIAELLKPLGYATACFGKWHLGDDPGYLPTDQGFDEYFGIPYSNDMWPFHPWQGSVFDFPPLPLFEGSERIDTLEEQSQLTTQITERAVDFIGRHADRPFFLYVPHPMPHVPLFVSDKFAGANPERGLYGEVIAEIDWSVGQILEALEKHGLSDNTWVIFTSDNGPWLSYGTHSGSALPLREGKGTSWEGGIRVPCVMRWPGVIPAGDSVDTPLMTIDLLPTIAQVTGAELPPRRIDGLNVLPLLQGAEGAENPHDAYYVYYRKNELQAIISGRWKLNLPHTYRSLVDGGGEGGLPADYQQLASDLELYDLQGDISERTNVADQYPEVVDRLLQYAERARADLGDSLTDREGANVREPAWIKKES